ncbi:MAG: hypothetical protein JRH16_16480 [Deltaproteobacteria bacterium]|nr:hypothetical protein [Deltaproteobacteria bacterium]MBW2362161.1 hypothetical protein [Deltaproteobacteria bacterium]
MILSATCILAISFAYAFARYVVLGPVAPAQIPVFLLNKGFAMAAVVFLFCAAVSHAVRRPENARSWGTAALHCGTLHALLSFTILSSAYFPALFEGERMSLRGELTVCFGVLAVYGSWLLRRDGLRSTAKKLLQLLSTLAIAGHLIALGSARWLDAAGWYGGMPPISLISLLFVMACLLLFLTGAGPSMPRTASRSTNARETIV